MITHRPSPPSQNVLSAHKTSMRGYSGMDPVQLDKVPCLIGNNGESLYAPLNPDFLIVSPYDPFGDRTAGRERQGNPGGLTDEELASSYFFYNLAEQDFLDTFWSPPDPITLIPYDDWGDAGLVTNDDGMSCSLTPAGLAAVYGDSNPNMSSTDNILPEDPPASPTAEDTEDIGTTTIAFNEAATNAGPDEPAPQPESPSTAPTYLASRPAANAPSFALKA